MKKKTRILITLLAIFYLNHSYGVNIYWVGNSGKWSDLSHWALTSGGNVRPSAIPGAGDKVIFDANSFSEPNHVVLMDLQNTFCFSLDMSKVDKKTKIQGLKTGVLNIFGNFLLTDNIIFNAPNEVNFSSLENNALIQMGGNSFAGLVRFRENSGSFQLNGDIKIDSILILESGFFSSKGFKIKTKFLRIYINNSKTNINLDNSNIEIWGKKYLNIDATGTISYFGGNFSGNNTSFILTSDDASFRANSIAGKLRWDALNFTSQFGISNLSVDSLNLNKLFLNNETFVRGSISMDSLSLGKGRTYRFQGGKNYRFKYLSAQGDCANHIQIFSETPGLKAKFISNSNEIKGDFLILRDITGTGLAKFMAINSSDLGNNEGWSFPLKGNTNLYWIGGTGNWYDTKNWSYESGGKPSYCVPSSATNVFFDEFSFSDSGGAVSLDIEDAYCRSMNWIGVKGKVSFKGDRTENLHILGSLYLDENVIWDIYGDVYFEGSEVSSGINIFGIKMENQTIKNNLYFNGLSNWKLEDNLIVTSNLFLNKGGLITNDKFLQCFRFLSESAENRFLMLGNSLVVILGDISRSSLAIYSNNFLLFSGNSLIKIINPTSVNISGNNPLKFNYFEHNSSLSISVGNSFFAKNPVIQFNSFKSNNDLIVGGKFLRFIRWEVTGGHKYKINIGDTLYVNDLKSTNKCNELIYFGSSQDDLRSSIYFENNHNLENFIVKDLISIGIGKAKFQNSVNLGNNINIDFVSKIERTLYWVGGAGLWTDNSHWSLESNGVGGECIPTPIDNVVINEYSFSNREESIVLDKHAYAKNLSIKGILFSPNIYTKSETDLDIYGNLYFPSRDSARIFIFKLGFKGSLTMNSIHLSGQSLNNVLFGGSGRWTIMDSLKCNRLYLYNGILNTNNNKIVIGQFLENYNLAKKLILGSSHCYITDVYFQCISNYFIIEPGNSTLEFTNNGALIENFSHNYHRILFSNIKSNGRLETWSGTSNIKTLDFRSNGTINGKHVMDSVLLYPGKSYKLDAYNPQEITKYFRVIGNNCNPIELNSTQVGIQAKIIMNSGIIIGDFIQMRDQIGIGAIKFNAGFRSVDIGKSNNNWIFDTPSSFIPEGFLGPDLVLCKNKPITLNAYTYSPDEKYKWFNNSVEPLMKVELPGKYWAEVTFGNACTIYDTIQIIKGPEFKVVLPEDTTICKGEFIDINASISEPEAFYEWQDGSQSSSYKISNEGVFHVSVALKGCTERDSMQVYTKDLPIFKLGQDTTLCDRPNHRINVTIPPESTIKWNTGSLNPIIDVNRTGTYIATANLNECKWIDTIAITFVSPIDVNLGKDTTICEGKNILLATKAKGDKYVWQDKTIGKEFLAERDGFYKLQVYSGNCVYSDSIYINTKKCIVYSVFAPNVFSPNNDGVNDDFRLFFQPDTKIVSFEMLIYDRWGKQVFQTNTNEVGWNGNINGILANSGVYIYHFRVEYIDENGPGKDFKSGNISLIR